MIVMCPTRGLCPPKHNERSRARRTRKRTHQAGSPGSGTSPDYPGVDARCVATIAYAIRRSGPVRSVKRAFYSLCSRIAPAAAAPEPDSSMYYPTGKGKRRRMVKFVRGPDLDPVVPSASYELSRPAGVRSRTPAVLKAFATPWIGYDARVTGTYLEDPVFRKYRSCLLRFLGEKKKFRRGACIFSDEEAAEFDGNKYLSRFLGCRPSTTRYLSRPLLRTSISDYTLAIALSDVEGERISLAAMVYEHLYVLREFLPDIW